jgi:hypothetical protein
MGVYVHPSTRQRIPFSKNCGDIEFDLSGDEAVVTEDLPLIGNWKDWTGEGGVSTNTQMLFASQENTLQGDDADVDGKAKVPNLNVRGIRLQTHRQRVIKQYVGNPSKS